MKLGMWVGIVVVVGFEIVAVVVKAVKFSQKLVKTWCRVGNG